jgi:hypothetical protein
MPTGCGETSKTAAIEAKNIPNTAPLVPGPLLAAVRPIIFNQDNGSTKKITKNNANTTVI